MKFLSRTFVFTTIALSVSLPCRFTFAQWSNNPSVNNVICAVPSNYPAIAGDGVGGVFIVGKIIVMVVMEEYTRST